MAVCGGDRGWEGLFGCFLIYMFCRLIEDLGSSFRIKSQFCRGWNKSGKKKKR